MSDTDIEEQVRAAKVLADNFARNKAFTKAGANSFSTALLPPQEAQFQQYLQEKHDPRDIGRSDDLGYDMRGWWQAMQANDPRAQLQLQPDGYFHRNDYWKTPYHQSFSAESQWADPSKAPNWNNQNQLVAPNGTVVFDEKAKK